MNLEAAQFSEPCVSSYTHDLVVMGLVLFFLVTGALAYLASFMQDARNWQRFVALVGGEDMADANMERLEVDNAAFDQAVRASIQRELAASNLYRERLARFNQDCQ